MQWNIGEFLLKKGILSKEVKRYVDVSVFRVR